MFATAGSTKSTLRRGAATIAIVAVMAGCSDGSEEASSDSVTQTTEAAAPTTEVPETTDVPMAPATTETPENTEPPATTEASEPDASVPGDVLTQPGTELALGDTAIVTIETDLPDEHVALTVEAIREGAAGDIDVLQIPDVPSGAKLWYVDYTVTNVSAAETSGDYMPSTGNQFGVLSADDQAFVPVIKFVSFDACENENPSDLAVGESVTTCRIFLAEDGSAADRVVFTPDFDTQFIIWR